MVMLQYASVMEVLQFALACIGLGLAMWAVWVAFEDAVELTDAPRDDLRRLIALGNMRAQLARVSTQGILMFVGIVSVLLPPPTNAVLDIEPELEQAFLVRLGLMAITAILTFDSFMERKQRIYFMSRVPVKVNTPTKEVSLVIDVKEVAKTAFTNTDATLPAERTPPAPEANGQ